MSKASWQRAAIWAHARSEGCRPPGPCTRRGRLPTTRSRIRTPRRLSASHLQLAGLENAVTAAAQHGGGWFPPRIRSRVPPGTDEGFRRLVPVMHVDPTGGLRCRLLLVPRLAGEPGSAGWGAGRDRCADRPPGARSTRTHPFATRTNDRIPQFRRRISQPILARIPACPVPHHVHATFFLSTGGVSAYPGTMTWGQLSTLHSQGEEIGGETVHHVSLKRKVGYARKVQEVCQDREALIQHGLQPATFAYPLGIYNPIAEKIVEGCGYGAARAAGGISSTGRVYAETIPPRDPFATRTANGPPGPIRLADMQRAIRAAARRRRRMGDADLLPRVLSDLRPAILRTVHEESPPHPTERSQFLPHLATLSSRRPSSNDRRYHGPGAGQGRALGAHGHFRLAR